MIAAHSGSYLGEDDIVRFEDVYGRQGHAAWLRQGTSMQNSEARKALHQSLRKISSIQALSPAPLPINAWGEARVQLDKLGKSPVTAITVRDKANGFNGFSAFTMWKPDLPGRKSVNARQSGTTYEDLANATRSLPP